MKRLLCLFIVVLTASQVAAETYSWVDDAGTTNFSDDFNSVPKKYRKKVRRFGDSDDVQTQPTEKVLQKSESSGLKSATAGDADKQLYNGKTQEAWRKEFEAQEAELKRLEMSLGQLQDMIKKPNQVSRERQPELYKEYEAVREEYNAKYKSYGDLMESARKAGLTVEIKK